MKRYIVVEVDSLFVDSLLRGISSIIFPKRQMVVDINPQCELCVGCELEDVKDNCSAFVLSKTRLQEKLDGVRK